MKKKILTCTVVALSFGLLSVPTTALAGNGQANGKQQTAATNGNGYRLKQKVYEQIKGWWKNESSGAYDWKVTRKKIKIYRKSSGECIEKMQICNCKKVKNGYIIKAKNSQGEKCAYSFSFQDENKNGICDNYEQGGRRQYQDSNNNGVCDNYENGSCGGNGRKNASNGKHRNCMK